MGYNHLRDFIAVVDTGSISAASACLNLTQPAVTRRVQNLEDRLGLQLLDRQSKPLRPTTAGKQAYALGRRVLGAVEDFFAGLSSEAEPAGELRLGITPYLSELTLMEAVDELRAEFPKLLLRVFAGWSPELLSQVESGALDAAAVVSPGNVRPSPHLVWELLGKEDAIVVASPELDLSKSTTLDEVARFPWILNPEGCGFRQAIQRRLQAAGLRFEVSVEASGADLQLSLVSRKLGIGLVTERQLATSPFKAALRIVTVRDLDINMRALLVYRPPAGRFAAPLTRLKESLATLLTRDTGTVTDRVKV